MIYILHTKHHAEKSIRKAMIEIFDTSVNIIMSTVKSLCKIDL